VLGTHEARAARGSAAASSVRGKERKREAKVTPQGIIAAEHNTAWAAID
jgi:hypothetical protein